MVKIYLIRHCEAEGNRLNIFQGTTDTDISELGARQLEFLKERFSDIHIDKAFSSPLLRARKTAEAAVSGKCLAITPMEEFVEIYGGVIEGENFNKSFEENPELAFVWDNRPEDFAAPEGEPMRAVYDRVWQGILKLSRDPDNQGKTLLVASHGAAIRCLMCRLLHGDISHLKSTPWSFNTAVNLLIAQGDEVTIDYMSDYSHLPEELVPKNIRILSVKNEE